MSVSKSLAARLLKRETIWRFGPGALGAGLLLLFALMRKFALPVYVFLTALPDGARKPVPFIDLFAILQAGKCWRAGVDVYRPSACLFGGTFNYSPFLLRAAYLPIGPQDRMAGGVLIAFAFFVALAFLPRPESAREFWVRVAGALSMTSFYALEQGNFDVVIFVVTVSALRPLLRARRDHSLSYGVIVLAAAAKFYPVALLVLVLREPCRRFLRIAALGALAGVLFLAHYAHGVAAALTTIPNSPPFRATFGRIDLFRGLNLLHLLTARGVDHLLGPVAFFSSGQTLAAVASWVASAVAIALSVRLRRGYGPALAQLRADAQLFLIAGAAVVVFCFYAAQNVEYRAIFLLLTFPGLWRMKRGRALIWAMLLLLWEAVIRAALHSPGLLTAGRSVLGDAQIAFWLLREGLWWWVAVELAAILLAFVTAEGLRLLREYRAINPRKIDGLAERL